MPQRPPSSDIASSVAVGVAAGTAAMFVYVFCSLDIDRGSGPDPATCLLLGFTSGPLAGVIALALHRVPRALRKTSSRR